VRRVRIFAGGALCVAICAFAIACATGTSSTDVGAGDDASDDLSRKEVTPAPPDPPPPPGSDSGGDSPSGDDGGGGCTTKVVVNELQVAGGGGASDEFIELFNPNTCSVSLASWNLYYRSSTDAPATGGGVLVHAFASESIAAKGYFLLAPSQFTGKVPDATYNATLAAAGGQVGLVDDKMKLVDAVGYGTAAGSYTEKTAAADPGTSQSVARKPNGADSDDNSKDLVVATSPTPGAAN